MSCSRLFLLPLQNDDDHIEQMNTLSWHECHCYCSNWITIENLVKSPYSLLKSLTRLNLLKPICNWNTYLDWFGTCLILLVFVLKMNHYWNTYLDLTDFCTLHIIYTYNGILFRKLFWPTGRIFFSSDLKNVTNSRRKAKVFIQIVSLTSFKFGQMTRK